MSDMILVHSADVYHWGIPGMRWGIRRYQNSDGTLTELGKQHYGKGGKANNKLDKAIKSTSKKIDKNSLNRRAALSYLRRPYQTLETRNYMINLYDKSSNKVKKNLNLEKDLLKIRGERLSKKADKITDNDYSDDRTILKKGTVLNSVSDKYVDSENYKKQAPLIYAYKDSEKWDNTVYKGPYSAYIAQTRGSQFIREHKFQTVKDLLMPTKQQRMEAFTEMLGDKKLKKDLQEVQQIILSSNYNPKKKEQIRKLDLNKIETEDDINAAYDIFMHCMEDTSRYRSAAAYIKKMSKNYDAMSDDNNQGVYNNAVDPIIVFRASKVLDTYSDVNLKDFLTAEEIESNVDKVFKKLGKVSY